MADILKFIPYLKDAEGGMSSSPNDTASANCCPYSFFGKTGIHTSIGGITWSVWSEKYGVTPDSAQRFFLMSDDDYMSIVKPLYWDKCLADEINSQQIANIIVDFAYNSGVSTAIKHVQQLIGATPDGIPGQQTIGLINASDSDNLYSNIMEARKAFYNEIVANNAKEQPNLEGWLNRLTKIQTYNATLT